MKFSDMFGKKKPSISQLNKEQEILANIDRDLLSELSFENHSVQEPNIATSEQAILGNKNHIDMDMGIDMNIPVDINIDELEKISNKNNKHNIDSKKNTLSKTQNELFSKSTNAHKLNLISIEKETNIEKENIETVGKKINSKNYAKNSEISKQSSEDDPKSLKQVLDTVTIGYAGHRNRIKAQLLKHGAHTFKDYELMELLLTYSIPRSDTKPLAKALLVEFKNFKSVFLTPKENLAKVKGMGESTVCFMQVVHEIACRMALDDMRDEVLLNSPEKVINYCKLRMSGLPYEEFRVLFLNRKNKLLFDEQLQSGTIDKAAVFPRELVKRAIDVGAGALILVHNHPTGDPTPSKADIETTINIQKAAKLMEIFLYDHIIVGKNNHYSMRANNLIK